MTLRKNISGADLVTPFVNGEVAAGKVVETPDFQPDGSPLIWDPAIWSEDTADDHPSARARKAAEKAAREAEAAAQAEHDAVHADNAPNSDDGGNAGPADQ